MKLIQHILETDKYRHNKSCVRGNTDIQKALAIRFSSHTTEGGSVFSVTPEMARWLLYTYRHELPPVKKAKNISFVTNMINTEGFKNNWPKEPVRIDAFTGEIYSGSKRLYALAAARQGTFIEIELVIN